MPPNRSPLKTNPNPFSRSAQTIALAGLLSFASSVPTFAKFLELPEATVEDPGLALEPTEEISGTVIAAQDSLFQTSADFQGILRSMVVDTGLGCDFYYQLVNTGTDQGFGADIFRMKTLGGFDGLTLTVTYRSDLVGLDFGNFSNGPTDGAGTYDVGKNSVFSADRDQGSAGSVGFDFSPGHFLFDPANINPGQTSMFAVVHTNATSYLAVSMDISGIDTARIASFAPVPEPRAAVLFAVGSALLLRRRAYRW